MEQKEKIKSSTEEWKKYDKIEYKGNYADGSNEDYTETYRIRKSNSIPVKIENNESHPCLNCSKITNWKTKNYTFYCQDCNLEFEHYISGYEFNSRYF